MSDASKVLRFPVEPGVKFHILSNAPDNRGSSFSVPANLLPPEFSAKDLHVMTIERGAVRGDHYHMRKREVFIVSYDGSWSLIWDDGESGSVIHTEQFAGSGVVVVLVPPLISHAVRNDDAERLHLVAISDAPYLVDEPDAHRRVVSNV